MTLEQPVGEREASPTKRSSVVPLFAVIGGLSLVVVAVGCGVLVAVACGVLVAVACGVLVAVAWAVLVAPAVGVRVGVAVLVAVLVAASVGVNVGPSDTGVQPALPKASVVWFAP